MSDSLLGLHLPPLERWPITTKDALRRGFPREVMSNAAPDDCRFAPSSGTADRIVVAHDFAKRDHMRAAELRALSIAARCSVGVCLVEIPPDACNLHCGLRETEPEEIGAYLARGLRRNRFRETEWLRGLRGRIERQLLWRKRTLQPIPSLPAGQLVERLDRVIDQLQQLAPTIVRGLPVYLLWLGDRLAERKVRLPGLRAVLPFGGMTTKAMRRRIEAGFRAPFRDVYGSSEFGAIGAECGRGEGIHVFEDLFVVETVRNEECVMGETGNVLITDLTNRAMPLIRYAIGDVGRLVRGRCGCGRNTQRLVLYGRVEELVTAEDGTVRTAADVADLAFSDPALWNVLLETKRNGRYRLSVVERPSAQIDEQRMRDSFVRLLSLSDPERLELRRVRSLRPAASGKYRFCRSREPQLEGKW